MDGKGQGMIPVVIEELAMMGGKREIILTGLEREGGRGESFVMVMERRELHTHLHNPKTKGMERN